MTGTAGAQGGLNAGRYTVVRTADGGAAPRHKRPKMNQVTVLAIMHAARAPNIRHAGQPGLSFELHIVPVYDTGQEATGGNPAPEWNVRVLQHPSDTIRILTQVLIGLCGSLIPVP